MGSIWGFQCGCCRAEFLAARDFAGPVGRRPWLPPVLCCGQPLRLLDPDQVLSLELPRRRVARCPRCGYELGLIIYPAGPLVCLLCQRELLCIGLDVKSEREDKTLTPAPHALEARR